MNLDNTLDKIKKEVKINPNDNDNIEPENKKNKKDNEITKENISLKKNKESQNPKEEKDIKKNDNICYLFYKVMKKKTASKCLQFSNNYDKYYQNNTLPYNNLRSTEKKIFRYQNGDILNIDPSFSNILTKDNFSKDLIATRQNLIDFIINNNYRKKAVINTIIFIFMLIIQIISVYFFSFEYFCINKKVGSKDSNYWECPKYKKCKVVEKRWFHLSNILKTVYYLIFYVFYYFYKIIILWKFECKLIRKCQNKILIIIYKILEYSLLFAFILLDFYDDSKCYYYIVNKKKIFIKINKYTLDLGESIIDLFMKLLNN